MTLPINPLAQLVSDTSTAIAAAAEGAAAAAESAATELQKLELDNKIAELSQFATAQADALGANLGGAMGGLGNAIQSTIPQIGNAIGSLQEATGAISNIAGDIAGTINKLGAGDLAGGLSTALGAISKTAGFLNNILSLKRGRNLPAGGESFLTNGNAVNVDVAPGDDWRIRVGTNFDAFGSNPWFGLLKATGGVVFPYLPTIELGSTANYSTLDPVHNNYPLYAYKNSQVNDITISGTFTAENEKDAAYWIAANLFFRTATKMFFGQGDNAGNPPIICKLNGYGSKVFNNVPVIIKTYNVSLSDDTQYVRCNYLQANTWVPIKSTVSLTLAPIYNRQTLRKFNLQNYSSGSMAGYL
jgi:hypothetical protein